MPRCERFAGLMADLAQARPGATTGITLCDAPEGELDRLEDRLTVVHCFPAMTTATTIPSANPIAM